MDYWESLVTLIKENGIRIDRKKGTAHPRFPDFVSPVDYGYVNKSRSMDNNAIDIFIGSEAQKEVNGIICTFDSLKNDSEIKILYSCSDTEIEAILNFYNMSKFMKAVLLKRDEL